MLKKLFRYFDKKPEPKTEYGIKVSLTEDLQVKVELFYPDVNKFDVDAIPAVAEKFAELFIYISSSSFKAKLSELVNNKSYQNDNIKEKLFFDNLISFYDLLRSEIQKTNNSSAPLIRPISAFNLK